MDIFFTFEFTAEAVEKLVQMVYIHLLLYEYSQIFYYNFLRVQLYIRAYITYKQYILPRSFDNLVRVCRSRVCAVSPFVTCSVVSSFLVASQGLFGLSSLV